MKKRFPRIKPYRRDIIVPAHDHQFARVVHIHLTPEEIPEVQALADKLGMSLDALVEYYVAPGDPMRVRLKEPPAIELERIILLPALTPLAVVRLNRAVEMCETTLERFIADAITGAIHGAEDVMLVDPRNGQLIGEDFLFTLLMRDVDYYHGGNKV